jgi:predicted ATP-binding protein involved in virulence
MEKWQGRLMLTSLGLRNFRQFEELNIAFDDKLTVFIGVNGSGKSTVVEALTKVMRIFAERIQRPDSSLEDIRHYFLDSDIKIGKDESEIRIKAELKPIKDDVLKAQREEEEVERVRMFQEELDHFRQEAFEQTQAAKINYQSDPVRLKDIERDIQGDLENEEKKLREKYSLSIEQAYFRDFEIDWSIARERAVFKEGTTSDLTTIERIGRDIDEFRFSLIRPIVVHLPVLVLYPCDLLHDKDSKTSINNFRDIFSAYRDAFDGTPVSVRALTYWFRAEEGRARENGRSSMLEAVTSAIYRFLNDTNSEFNNLRISYQSNDEGEMLIDKNGIPLSISQLSSGEKMLFLMVADLARRLAIATPGSDDPCTEGSGIVLIDEIDLHLHPRWQLRVIPQLQKTFRNIQFVVTTHSPLVLQGVQRENIRVLELGRISEDVPYVYGRDVNSLIKDVFIIDIRPQHIAKKIEEIERLIDDENEAGAQEKLQELKKIWGEEDQEFQRLSLHTELI